MLVTVAVISSPLYANKHWSMSAFADAAPWYLFLQTRKWLGSGQE